MRVIGLMMVMHDVMVVRELRVVLVSSSGGSVVGMRVGVLWVKM